MKQNFFVERDCCPLCGSDKKKILYKKSFNYEPIKKYLVDFYPGPGGVNFEYLEDQEYILCECEQCNLIYQLKIPNAELMNILYEKWINPELSLSSRSQKSSTFYKQYAIEIMTIGSLFEKNPSQLKFLDFGMGWGDWLLMASSFGYDCYGLESSESRIKYAKQRGLKVIDWEEAKNIRFDFINTEQVFEHIPDPLETLIKLKKLLKPNGLIKISVPAARDINRRLDLMDWQAPKGSKNSLNPVAPLEHIQYFRRSSLDRMAEKAGMFEFKVPFKVQYDNQMGWLNSRSFIKNAVLPIYRNWLQQGNYVFFKSK